jgi:hypothetical protein
MTEVHSVKIADGYNRPLARVAKSFDPPFGGVGDI